jgi:glycosyltransferase involved in cell wall biosynthesis
VHHAIAIARGAGRRLVIAGNRVTTPEGEAYFEEEVAPHLDGDAVIHVGEVDDEAKARWLGCAAALLMPIEWEEPFGIVMAEALACGTPVIGFARGAVPEVVIDGRTGFVCRTPGEAVAAVARLAGINRAACRDDASRRFSSRALVDAYEHVYATALGGGHAA